MIRPPGPVDLTVCTVLPAALGIKFAELCDRMDCDRAWIIRELIQMAVASDDFVRAAIGDDYQGDFVVDINLPDVEAVKMYEICKEKADANRNKNEEPNPNPDSDPDL